MDLSLSGLFSLQGILTLAMLVVLQAVLGFDNLLYISLESKRVEASKQSAVRKLGVGLAIFLRMGLLIVLLLAIDNMKAPFFTYGLTLDPDTEHVAHPANDHVLDHDMQNWKLNESGNVLAISLNVHGVVVLLGGIFIIYAAFKEIVHLLAIDRNPSQNDSPDRSPWVAVFWIMVMNLVFSFDSILSAIALTKNVWIMGTAIFISGVLMIWLSDHVAEFLQRNRMYEVLGLFILFIVGILLVSEGAYLSHLVLFQHEIQPMAKATFYFVIAILVAIDVIQSRYQKKLFAEQQLDDSMA